MEIICEIEDYNKNADIKPKNLKKDRYLILTKNQEKLYILFSEFEILYNEPSGRKDESNSDIETGVSKTISMTPEIRPKIGESNFNGLMDYLKKELEIKESSFDDNNELTLEANFDHFLELPWENIVDKNIIVYRKVKSDERDSTQEKVDNNFLFVISYANRKNNGGSLDDLKNGIKREVLEIENELYNIEFKSFKVNKIKTLLHATKEKFNSLNLDKYNYIYFAMHGDIDGTLCLGKADKYDYKCIDNLSSAELEEKLKDKNIYLLFLSLCNSAGSSTGGNLAFNMVFKNISKYVIAYKYDIGENAARYFSKHFYKYLLENNNNVKESYKKALKKFLENNKKNIKYHPVLYINK